MTNPTPRHQRPARVKKFLFGAPYYPEHWTAEDMRDDADRMVRAGMNVVRMAEFAWDLMEPRPGEFDFSLFDRTIEKLGSRGIDTILCTPTATPPRWLTEGHEDWMRVDRDGRRMIHGSRQHCCTTNPAFRAESERITCAMAEHFKDHSHVIGWQTDNELNCHFSECHCPACAEGFRAWLRKKYGDIHALNDAWGTAFWAQTYDGFAQILPPIPNRPTHPNPSQSLDFYRFHSDAVVEFQRGQTEILRAVQPQWWLTHNGLFGHIDYWKFTEDLDFLSIDIYPGFAAPHPQSFDWASHRLQSCRAASGSFIIPEQEGGAGGQSSYLNPICPPGRMRLWAWQAVAHGADGILHFRWRTCRFGAEMYWNGILDHDNIPRRRYEEFAQEGSEFARVGDRILGTVQTVRAGVLVETDQAEAHLTFSQGLPGMEQQSKLALRQLLLRHLPCGLIQAEDLFAGLDLLVVPSFVLMDEDLAARLRAFVEGGGTLVATARTATRDRRNHVLASTPPGGLTDVFGIAVEEFGKLADSACHLMAGDRSISAGEGYEILHLRGAEVLATWSRPDDGFPHAATGEAAMTVHRLGAGQAIYLGTWLSDDNAGAIFDIILERKNLAPLAHADEFVEITRRHDSRGALIFLLNHYGEEKTVTEFPAGREILTGNDHSGRFVLPPYGVAVIEERG